MFHRHTIAALLIGAGALASPRAATPAGFALLSRDLIQGPARTACFGEGGLVLGAGGGIAVFRDADRLDEPAFLPIEGEPRGLCVRGPVVYIAAFSGGLRTIDISDPAHPFEAHHRAIAQATRCATAGGALFVSDARGGLHVFTLENPRVPRFKETLKLRYAPNAIPAEGEILAAVYGGAAEIFRATAAGSLEKTAEIDLDQGMKEAVVHDGVLFTLTSSGRVFAWDLSRPEAPTSLGLLPRGKIIDIAAGEGACALLGASRTVIPLTVERGGDGAARIRIHAAMHLPPRSYDSPPAAVGGGGAAAMRKSRLIVSASRVAAIAPLNGIDVYAIERKRLQHLAFHPTGGIALGVAVENGIVYLANGNDGVRIGRLEDDGTISWRGHLQTHDARAVALHGDALFIADGMGGLKIADVRDPSRARFIGGRPSPHYLSALVVRGDRAYCAAGFGGVEIFDVSNPRRPRLVWRRAFSEVRGLDTDGRYLYVADGYEGLHIFSLDDGEPRHVSSLDTPGWNADVAVGGRWAYLSDGGRGIVTADVASHDRPRAVSSSPTGSIARQLCLDGTTLFVAAFTSGVIAFDLSDPARPVEAARFQTVGDARAVRAEGRRICVASGSGGVYVLEYSP